MGSEISFVVDAAGRRTHAIVPIETYNTLLAMQELLKSGSFKQRDELYYLNFKQHQAKGYPIGPHQKPQFVLARGSQTELMNAPSLPSRIVELKEELLASGKLTLDPEHNCFVLNEDVKLPSPSQAALLCTGMVVNGLDAFVNTAGFSLRSSGYGRKRRTKHGARSPQSAEIK